MSFMSFPERGRDTDRTPVLATAAVSHHIEFTSLESLDKFRSELQLRSPQVSQKSNSPTTDLSIQKRAVSMYSDEKLLFYDLFIKSLIENFHGASVFRGYSFSPNGKLLSFLCPALPRPRRVEAGMGICPPLS